MKTINWYLEKVQDLDTETFVSPHQITIDMIEEVLEDLWEWKEDAVIPLDTLLGSLNYRVGNILEVIDKQHTKDIETLKKLSSILETM